MFIALDPSLPFLLRINVWFLGGDQIRQRTLADSTAVIRDFRNHAFRLEYRSQYSTEHAFLTDGALAADPRPPRDFFGTDHILPPRLEESIRSRKYVFGGHNVKR